MADEPHRRYRVLERIGAGGMGEVYRAYDHRLKREVAIKMLPQGVDAFVRKSLRKEASVLSKLTHPNIETLFDFDDQEGSEFMVVEYVPGITLSDQLAKGPLTEKEVARLGVQLASGLAAAHAQRVVHRDLKPSNLRITSDHRLKILDFGVAKLLKAASPSETESTTSTSGDQGLAGTVAYMAPEQLRNEATDARTDIYAAGEILYEMATGQRPFAEVQMPGLIDAMLHKPPAPPRALNPRLSPEMERIIIKCMQKEPENRYQSAQELEVDLRQLAGPDAVKTVERAPTSNWRRASLGAVAVLALTITLLGLNVGGWRNRLLGANRQPQFESLAVLPLTNLSGNVDQDYFADGITEELITTLAKISSLRVISRTSVMQYKGTRKSVPQIAAELHVDAVVEGSVQRSGDRVRITAQLIRADTDQHLWAESYERNLRDVLTLRSEMASAIANQIQIKLTSQERARLGGAYAVNPEAYENYLKGRFYWHRRGTEAARSLYYFEQAIAADPNYAPGYAGLADYYWAADNLPPQTAIPKAREYAMKALQIDDTLAEAHTALAAIRFYGEWDWPAAQQEFNRALQVNPNQAEARRMYAVYLAALGRSGESLAEIRRAQELDPLSESIQGTAGWVFYFSRQYDHAIEQCRIAVGLDSNSAAAHDCLGTAYLAEGMHEQAISECETAVRVSGNVPDRMADLARAYALAGEQAQAQKLLAQLRDLAAKRYVSPYFFAIVYASLGDRDGALSSLQKAYDERSGGVIWIKSEPTFDGLRGEPRFQDLLRRLHFSA